MKKLDHLTSIPVDAPPKKGTPDYDDFFAYLPHALARIKGGEPLLYDSTSTEKLNENARATMTLYEAAANSGTIEAHMKILYEVDCTNDLLRYLSLTLRGANGNVSTLDTPETWKHIPPESNGSRLAALVAMPSDR